MKIILTIFFISSVALAETAISPIVKGGPKQQQSYSGPKRPIATLPPSPPPPPAAPIPEPEKPNPFAYAQRFWEVVNWYQNGRNVKWSEIKGSYVGVCLPTPTAPYARWPEVAFLSYWGSSRSGYPGIFVSRDILSIKLDKKEPDSAITPEIIKYWKYEIQNDYLVKKYSSAGFSDDETVTQKFYFTDYSSWKAHSKDEYRMFGNTLVSIKTMLVSHYLERGGGLGVTGYAWQIMYTCYYDRKVED